MTTQLRNDVLSITNGGTVPWGAARDLRRRFRGPVHLPGSGRYDATRATFSGAVDPRPALVAEAWTPDDVRAAVLAAWEHELPFAVQATGHGTHVPADGGLLVKTSAMAEVLVDPDRRIARVGPGARWAQVLAAAAPFGLAPLCGSSPDVGVAGFTLGGGVGWLSRRFGFAADSLVAADVVTADGRLVTASARSNPDLFWALRGGGGNFGVVTALELRLHPVGRVYGGAALFGIDRAADTLVRLREIAAAQPDELTASVVLLRTSPDPAVEGPVLAIRAVHAGDEAAGARALRPLLRAAGTRLAGGFRPLAFAETPGLGGTAPRHFELFEQLSDPVIAAVVGAVRRVESAANAVEVRHWGGAMARPGVDAGPVGHRDVPFSVTVDGPPAAAAPLAKHATGGSFLNFLADPARTRSAYTAANWQRLRALKRPHDPENVFGLVHNIAPAAA